MAALVERYRAAESGRGSFVAVGGEAGIGKSRLLSEVRGRLGLDRSHFAVGYSLPHARAPLAPLIDVLQTLRRAWPRTGRIAQLCAALAGTPSRAGAPDAPAAPNRRALFAALARALREIAADHPQVIAVEDAHWADLATLDFLQHLIECVADTRLLVLLTHRTDEPGPAGGPWQLALARFARSPGGGSISVRGLSRADSSALVSESLRAHEPPAPAVVQRIIELAEGRPLFAEELLRHAIDGELGGPARRSLPHSLEAAVYERLALLEPHERALLIDAAVLGRRFEPAFLGLVSERTNAEVLAALRHGRDLQLLVEDRTGGLHYAFRHALVREALYGTLREREARALHARIGARMELAPDGAQRTVELAYHWWAAREPAKAVEYNERAGDDAARVFAHRDAASFYERALDFIPASTPRSAELYEKLGRTLGDAGAPDRARLAFERAVTYYESTGESLRAGDLCLSAGQQAYNALHPASLAWRLRALNALKSVPDDPLAYEALIDVAKGYIFRGDVELASEHLERAARFRGTPRAECAVDFHNYRAVCAWMRGDSAGALAAYADALAAVTDDVRPQTVVVCRANFGHVAALLGEREIALDELDAAAARAAARHLPLLEASAHACRARALLCFGELERSRAALERTAELLEYSESSYVRLVLAEISIHVGLRLGDPQLIERFAADDVIQRALASGDSLNVATTAPAYAELYASRGDAEGARLLLRTALTRVHNIAIAPWFPLSFVRYGDADSLPRARALLTTWARGPANRVGRAFVALLDAFEEADPRRATTAARDFATIGFPYYEAFALEKAGDYERAAAVFRAIGCRGDAARADVLREEAQARLASRITARQYQIACSVASGKTNRRIAEEFSLSDRTVENHVAAVMRAYDIHTRADLAARVARGEIKPG